MSKKQYIQPRVLNKEVIEPDQAIAACTIGHGNYIAVGPEYHVQLAGSIGYDSTWFSSKSEALTRARWSLTGKALGLYRIYYGSVSDENFVCYYDDFDLNDTIDLSSQDTWDLGNKGSKDNIYYQSLLSNGNFQS